MKRLPFLFVPGLICTSRLFEHQIHSLWQLGPVMVADHTKANNIKDMAKNILADAPQKFNLLGLSMGGYISLEILRQAPGRIEKLVLMDTSARADTPEQTETRTRAIKVTEMGKYAQIADDLWPKLVDKKHLNNEEIFNITKIMAQECGPDVFINQQKTIMSRPDSREFLKEIKQKTLIIVGKSDQLTPVDIAKEINDGIKDSRLEIVENAGHLSTLEQPEKISELLLDFFKN